MSRNTGWSKKSALFCFSSQSCVLKIFSIFFRWCRPQAWEILLTPIWIQLDAILRSTGWKASRCTLLQNQFFGHSGNAGRILAGTMYLWKDNLVFGGQISEDRKRGRCPRKPTSFIVQHNSREYSEFTGTPWGISQKINMQSLTRNWHFENISFEDAQWWP